MNPYEHAQQPASPEAPSGLPIAGSPPPAYDPNQGYAPAPAYEHAQPQAYGYDPAPSAAYGQIPHTAQGYQQAYQQPAASPAYPQTPEYHQNPGYQNPGYEQHPPAAYQQAPAYQQTTPAYQQAPAHQQTPPPPPPVAGGWGPPPETPPAYIITPGAPGAVTRKSGAGKRLALIAAAVLVVAGGGGAFAADAWAKGQVCDAVQGLDNDTSAPAKGKTKNSDEPSVAELDAAEKGLNSRADLLFFHGDLKEATHDLADDVDTLKTMTAKGKIDNPDAGTVTQLLALAASLDNHAKRAQRACGLPEKSLMGTTA